ncbi:MAG: hypothetical protein FWC91_08065 [Defluviitaleaceae bacterium]|nr:hypothetical protein [Defluviitaleaceae bacterium]
MKVNKKMLVFFAMTLALVATIPVMVIALEQSNRCLRSSESDEGIHRDYHIDQSWSMEERIEFMRSVLAEDQEGWGLDFMISQLRAFYLGDGDPVEPHGICIGCGWFYWQQDNIRLYGEWPIGQQDNIGICD